MSTPTRQITLGIDASRANARQKTGTEWYAYHLIEELKRIIPADIRVVLYSRKPLEGALAQLPAHWESRVLGWPPKLLWTQVRLSWEMLRWPPDALFVPVHVLPLVMPRLAAATLHDVAFVVEPRAYTAFERWYQRFAIWLARRRASVVFTVSDFSKRELESWFRIAAERIMVTPLGFDAGAFSVEERPDVLKKYGIRKPYFLFVGRLERKKNLQGLLRAFRELKTSGELDALLVLAGKRGHGYVDAMREVDNWRGKSDIVELGYVEQGDLPALYASAHAFVFPSFYEGFGIPVLEAFASGAPVIAARAGAIPEVAGDAAFYVDPEYPTQLAAAMRKLLHDEDMRLELRRKGSARKSEFSWKKTAELTWQALEKMLRDASTKK